jgi:phage/plasmid-associated DNA primase
MGERFGLQPLLYASGWIADDAVGQNEVMDAENYKKVVTGESVSVERKNKESIEIEFDLPVLLTMNNFPIVKDNSDAVYNRTLVLPMTHVRKEGGGIQIGELIVKTELAGVLNFAVAGWKRLKERGKFDPPEGMDAILRDFKSSNNPFGDFAKECLELNPHRMVKRSDLRDIFNGWMKKEMQNHRGWSGHAISRALRNTLPEVAGDECAHERMWVGVAFKEAALGYIEASYGEEKPQLIRLNSGLTAEIRSRYATQKHTEF